jgi:GTP-binding protein EngB required for normal cell division
MTASMPIPPKLNKGGRAATLPATLDQAMTVLESGIGTGSPLAVRLRALSKRLQQERLQIAVLGQFKRGKSSFINALLGAPILPTGVIPLTAVATFIAWGREPIVRIHFKEGKPPEQLAAQDPDAIREVLFRFVAEEANPENRLGVERVELFYPTSVLANGIVLIDTPGVGSTLRHNTDAALQILPECDAALFILSADPPITEVEIEYLRRLRLKTAHVFFILNKVDYLQPDEQRTIARFLQKVLSEKSLLDSDSSISCVSARNGLAAKQVGNGRELELSGIGTLEDHLLRRLATEKAGLLEEAIRTKATDILAQAAAEVDLGVRALNMPLEELASKSQNFQDALRSIEAQRRVTRDLLTGDQRRLREQLELRIDGLRREASSKLASVIDQNLTDSRLTAWDEAARRALSKAMEETFESARQQLVTTFSKDAENALSGHQDRIDLLVDSVRRTAADIFDVSFAQGLDHDSFELGHEPYWVTESIGSTLIPDSSRVVDHLLPSKFRRARLRGRIVQDADRLIVRNAENLRWAMLRGLEETFRKAAARFEQRLDDAIAATRGVVEDALTRRRNRSFAVEPEVDRLNRVTASLAAMREEFSVGPSLGGPQGEPRQLHDAAPSRLGSRNAGSRSLG